MQWLALVCVALIVAVFGGQWTSSFPRAEGKWSQAMYDRHLGFCVDAYHDSNLCACAVTSTEQILPLEQALIMEDQAAQPNEPGKNPVFKSVMEGVAWCRTPEGRQKNPAARTNTPVHASTEKVKDSVRRNMQYDPKTGRWSN